MSDVEKVENVQCSTVLNLNLLSPNCRKLALECDWNRNFFNAYEIWVIFEKERWVFWMKLDFSQNRWRWQIWRRMRIKWYYFIHMFLLNLNWGLFFRNWKKLNVEKNYQNLPTIKFFRENDFILLKGILSKFRERKICRC